MIYWKKYPEDKPERSELTLIRVKGKLIKKLNFQDYFYWVGSLEQLDNSPAYEEFFILKLTEYDWVNLEKMYIPRDHDPDTI